ncbi:MAG TPA: hypothetical protein VNA11_02185 [Pseudonocardia sp.]|nr:hypothetical protein [Pseudonocardia sp.]
MNDTTTTVDGLRQQAADRLTVLRHELALGEARLTELQREQAQLQQTLLRISGAVQVLDELIGPSGGPAPEPVG